MNNGQVFINAEDGKRLVDTAEWARKFRQRCQGLIGRRPIGKGRGMLLAPCRAVHTCFMSFDLDLIFFSRDFRVVRMVTNVAPWRVVFGGWQAWGVLEVQSGWFPRGRLRKGEQLVFGGRESPGPPAGGHLGQAER
ncbi:DUF192 domain-containing protein [Verrucomicrobiota bacterium]